MARPAKKGKNRNPVNTRAAERTYRAQLRKVARQVGTLIEGLNPQDQASIPTISQTLRAYADVLLPWARSTAQQMLDAVNQKDVEGWRVVSAEISRELREEIMNAPTGELLRQLLDEQVTLIRSIPLDAAQRVHEMTLKGLEDSTRASVIAKEIGRSGKVAESRAMLIARTEVARTASALTEARALHIGSQGYIWRTSGDGDVRESHREMNGRYVDWKKPPTLSDGTTTHAGQIYNCRCYPEPVIPKD